MNSALLFFVVLAAVFCAIVAPIYVIGRRTGVRNSWAAFVPLLGAWIVLLESIRRNGWFSLLTFVPYIGPLVLLIWTAVEMPVRHERSRLWTLPLILPGVNLLAYWFYAFTLPRDEDEFAFA